MRLRRSQNPDVLHKAEKLLLPPVAHRVAQHRTAWSDKLVQHQQERVITARLVEQIRTEHQIEAMTRLVQRTHVCHITPNQPSDARTPCN
eukprot:5976149-Prymnesium_polylepis.2